MRNFVRVVTGFKVIAVILVVLVVSIGILILSGCTKQPEATTITERTEPCEACKKRFEELEKLLEELKKKDSEPPLQNFEK